MYLFKASAKTFASVVAHERHAFATAPKEWEKGELVLISKNRAGLQPGEKQIQYVMKLQDIRPARPGEIERYWPGSGARWKYLAEMYGRHRLLQPFDLEEVIGENVRHYWRAVTYRRLAPEDERLVEAFLAKQTRPGEGGKLRELDDAYRIAGPGDRPAIALRIEGDPRVVAALRKLHPTHCQLCGAEHLLTREGLPYFEVHLVESLCGPGSPTTDNCLVLCPTCHRKMHLAEVAVDAAGGDRLEVTVNGKRFSVLRNVLSAQQGR